MHYLAERTSQAGDQLHGVCDGLFFHPYVPHFLSRQGAWPELFAIALNIICISSKFLYVQFTKASIYWNSGTTCTWFVFTILFLMVSQVQDIYCILILLPPQPHLLRPVGVTPWEALEGGGQGEGAEGEERVPPHQPNCPSQVSRTLPILKRTWCLCRHTLSEAYSSHAYS